MLHPELPDCDECEVWMYDVKTWRRSTRSGRDVERPPGTHPPCWQCPKCKGHSKPSPDVGRRLRLSGRNLRTYARFWEHRAAGGVLADPITRKNFGLLLSIFEGLDRVYRRLAAERGGM